MLGVELLEPACNLTNQAQAGERFVIFQAGCVPRS